MKTSIRFYNDREVRAVWDEVVSVVSIFPEVLMSLVVLISSVVSMSSVVSTGSTTVPSVPELVEGTIATHVEGIYTTPAKGTITKSNLP